MGTGASSPSGYSEVELLETIGGLYDAEARKAFEYHGKDDADGVRRVSEKTCRHFAKKRPWLLDADTERFAQVPDASLGGLLIPKRRRMTRTHRSRNITIRLRNFFTVLIMSCHSTAERTDILNVTMHCMGCPRC